MKKGKGFFTGLILVVVMAAIITGSLVAGYKFITTINKDAKKRFEEVSKNIESASKEKPIAMVRYQLLKLGAKSIETVPILSSIPDLQVLGL